jgi:prolyl-tRNA synthetase
VLLTLVPASMRALSLVSASMRAKHTRSGWLQGYLPMLSRALLTTRSSHFAVLFTAPTKKALVHPLLF